MSSLRRLPSVHVLLRALGPAGVIALGVLLFCVPFYFSAVRPAERELAAEQLRAAGAQRNAALSRSTNAQGNREAELARFYALFPPVERLGDELQRIYALAHKSHLELMQGEYRIERRPSGLIAYRVSLPVRGSYPQIRAFVGALLAELPIASLDALRFERKKSGDTQLEAQLRLTVHFRPSEEQP
jgi:hypothetical protein